MFSFFIYIMPLSASTVAYEAISLYGQQDYASGSPPDPWFLVTDKSTQTSIPASSFIAIHTVNIVNTEAGSSNDNGWVTPTEYKDSRSPFVLPDDAPSGLYSISYTVSLSSWGSHLLGFVALNGNINGTRYVMSETTAELLAGECEVYLAGGNSFDVALYWAGVSATSFPASASTNYFKARVNVSFVGEG